MNTATFFGYIGRDASYAEKSDSVKYCKFSIANNIGFGEKKRTLWINCIIWGDKAEKLNLYLQKGTPVVVTGEVEPHLYQSKDGEYKTSLSLNVKDLSFAGRAITEPNLENYNNPSENKKPDLKSCAEQKSKEKNQSNEDEFYFSTQQEEIENKQKQQQPDYLGDDDIPF